MKFLVFQHLDIEHPGVFREFWRESGVEWTTVGFEHGDPIPADLNAYDALVVMGGPMDVWQIDEHPWLVAEIVAIRRFVVELGRPFLGVCLGHQLLAQALGGEVGPARSPEVGACPVRLTEAAASDVVFRGLSSPLMTFQWHAAEVRRAPPGAVVLGETDLCRVQAFRWGGRAYGVQFHAEITEQTPAEWQSVPAYERSLEATLGAGGSDRLAAETQRLLPIYRDTAKHLSRNFATLVRTGLAFVG